MEQTLAPGDWVPCLEHDVVGGACSPIANGEGAMKPPCYKGIKILESPGRSVRMMGPGIGAKDFLWGPLDFVTPEGVD